MDVRKIILAVGLFVAASAQAQERVRVNMLSAQNFCYNLIRTLAMQTNHSLSTAERMQQATVAAQQIVGNIRVGRVAHVVPLNMLGLQEHGGSERELRRFMSMRDILTAGLNANADFLLAFDTDELKYIPHAVARTPILLLVKDAQALTPERARLITAIAQRNGITISVIWYGPNNEDGVRAATGLAFLSGMTQGVFVDLNGPSSCLTSSAAPALP